MISGTHTIQIDATTETVWEYLADFANWAPFVIGYQSHRTVDDKTSVWTLKGDVGVLSREVDLEVTVQEWEPGRRASFSINGLTERLEGTGAFRIAPSGAAAHAEETEVVDDVAAARPAAQQPAPRRTSWWSRLSRRMATRMLRRVQARSAAASSSPATPTGQAPTAPRAATPSAPGGSCELTFDLEVSPGGPMAPMVEMLMRPLLEPAAEDLSTRIRQQVEGAPRV